MQTKTKIIIGVVALIVILLIAFLIYRYASKSGNQSQTGTTTTTTSGSGGLASLLNNSGFTGWLGGLFGGGTNQYDTNGDGVVTSEELGCDPSACDPDKLGYNMCGDHWYPCE